MARDIALVTDGEVTRVDRVAVLLAIIMKTPHGSLEKAHSSVIPESINVLNQLGNTGKVGVIPSIRLDHEFRRFPEGDFGLKIPDDESDRFPVEPIRRVPNQSGPREGTGVDDIGSGRHEKEERWTI